MAKAKFEIKRKCEICGAWFYAQTIESRYCSKKCSEITSKKKKAEIEKLAKLEELVANIPDSRDYISVQRSCCHVFCQQDQIWEPYLVGGSMCLTTPSSLYLNYIT